MVDKKLKVSNAKSTNNFIVRFWSRNHYDEKFTQRDNMFEGSVTNVRTKEEKFFNTPSKMMTIFESEYKKAEKERKKVKK